MEIYERFRDEPIDSATDGPDGGGATGPPRMSPPSGQQPSHINPAIPSVLVVAFVIALAVFCWWFRRSVRRSRRYAPLLARLGMTPRPELVEVIAQHPRVPKNCADARWECISPLCLSRTSSLGGGHPWERTYSRSSESQVPSPSAPLRPYGATTPPSCRRPRKRMRSPQRPGVPSDVSQVVVFIAMPSPAHPVQADDSLAEFAGNGLPPLQLGVAGVQGRGYAVT
ncbi:hypothetical protein C8Q77DRAFT_88090 [Trametes polyzona]|nr:hypothetical protein C8Q77DRAFT_88090 [Trametes polyzona]